MISIILDASLYFKRRQGEFIGTSGASADNVLTAGRNDFRKDSDYTLQHFEKSGIDVLPLIFAGTISENYLMGPLPYTRCSICKR